MSISIRNNNTVKGYPRGVKPFRKDASGRKITGVAYEELPESIQQDLDDKPFDDAGNLRLFIRDSFTQNNYIELGSSSGMMASLREKAVRFGL